MTNIYVENLPSVADENLVRELFAQHGAVESVSIIMDRDTGLPCGVGFVEMSRADASRAIQNLNGKKLAGSLLRLHEAQERVVGRNGSWTQGDEYMSLSIPFLNAQRLPRS